jgi:hypothetical protein
MNTEMQPDEFEALTTFLAEGWEDAPTEEKREWIHALNLQVQRAGFPVLSLDSSVDTLVAWLSHNDHSGDFEAMNLADCWACLVGLLAPVRCGMCAAHYGDAGLCDEGKPVASPHHKRKVK